MARNMTTGKIAPTLALFAVPLILSGLLQQLYSWADALIVGNWVGETSLAAVGASGTITMLLTSILAGFCVGVSIQASYAFGEEDWDTVGKTTSTFLLVVGAASLALAALVIAATGPILRLLNTPADMFAEASVYIRVILLGTPVMAVYNVYNGVLRGIGDSRTPLYSILVSTVVNVGLDILFVAVFRWGVLGAAVATVIAQLLMTVYIAIYATVRYPALRFQAGRGMVDRGILRRGMRLSVPTAIQSAIRSVGSIMLQGIMNGFGTQVVASITTAYRIDSVALTPVVNLGSGISTFVAQNEGAGDKERSRQGMKVGVVMSLVVATVITALVIPFSGRFMALFGVTQGAVEIGREFFRLLAAFYPLFGVVSALQGYLIGAGDVTAVGIINIVGLALRIALSWLLTPLIGRRVIAVAELISWVFLAAAFALRYRVKYGKKKA